ncbi:hypothetical protein OG21DRAFT_339077 [Imleria badia]|nr:hypothetical protein OG21DRAFT_339077 [Imleria badia]
MTFKTSLFLVDVMVILYVYVAVHFGPGRLLVSIRPCTLGRFLASSLRPDAPGMSASPLVSYSSRLTSAFHPPSQSS